MIYDKLVLETFLNNQSQLFDETVVENLEEADEFLDICMATVVKSIKEVRQYFDESGMDVSGMSNDELKEASEVFELSDGRFLIVEG